MNKKSAYQQVHLQSRAQLKPVYAAVLLAFVVQAAHANPTGASVAAGSASFAASGNTLTVTNTPGTIINWQGFSIGSNEITHFVQQSASSAVLNRVTGSNPSNILGALQSNGRVFLVNPNGIVFGAGSVVDVAGLVASTLNLSDADFIAGNHHYTQIPGAQNISNAGNIAAQNGGQIYLIAPNVENTGVITAPNGEILLAAGASVDLVNTDNPNLRVNITAPAGDATNVGQLVASSGSLGLFGTVVRNSGTVSADSATLRGGKIVFKATQRVEAGGVISANGAVGGSVSVSAAHSIDPNTPGVVIQTGSIQAQGAAGTGGTVSMSADNILSTSSINVSGTTSGGRLNVAATGDIVTTAGAAYTANGGTASGGDILVAAGGNSYTSGSYLAQGATGGNITLTGKEVTLSAALLDASGLFGGGVIHVGGMRQGAPGFSALGMTLTNATNLTVTATSQIIANASQNGNGGEIVLWSDSTTRSAGSIAAHGGPSGGNGGFVEVSGKQALGYTGRLDLTAPHGTAGTLLLDPSNIIIDSAAPLGAFAGGTASAVLADPHPVAGNQFGAYTTVLTNGNIVIAVPADSLVAASAGAVYLFSGTTGALISTLAGSSASDRVGIGGVTALTNGNFVVDSYVWSAVTGAVTWGSGTTGVSGAVSSANSLVGNSSLSSVGYFGSLGGWDARNNISNSLLGHSSGVVALTNGNYVVTSPYWGGSNQGAVTWGSGTGGVTGFVSSANSLVGSSANDYVGFSVTALSNGNYVVGSPNWNGGGLYSGAATWGNGATGSVGAVSAANSIVGSANYDTVGASITALSNGNYVVNSYGWNSKSGAVTWGNGAGGTVGAVSAANSLVGTLGQNIGWGSGVNSTDGVVALTGNGNYVVNSSSAGFATWGNGSGGTVGNLSVANSLQGSAGTYATKVTALTNGNYVVANSFGNPGVVTGGGTVTWGNGVTGTVGTVTAANSLVGSTANDNVGSGGVVALSNGNYVLTSQNWDNVTVVNAGAVTWGNGVGGTVGAVSSANSLVGSTANDQVGWNGARSTVVALSNGNYVVGSPTWDSVVVDAGAATWGDGSTAGTRLVGTISSLNSLTGSTANDRVGANITALAGNGNYVVSSNWANGAILGAGAATWGNGATAGARLVGTISTANSLVGSTLNDGVGGNVVALPGGNYVVASSTWDSGAVANVGAVTWGNGLGGTVGAVSAANSLVGDVAGDQIGGWYLTVLANGNYVVNDPGWHANTGYVGMGSAASGLSGIASAANGAVGAVAGDYLGYDYAGANTAGGTGNGVRTLPNSCYVISSVAYNGGLASGVGRVSIEGIVGTSTNPNILFASAPSAPLSINPSDIIAQLNAGTSIILQANNDITQNAGAGITATGTGNLTMQAGRSVILNGMVNIQGALNITANDPGAIAIYRAAGVAVIDTTLATLTAASMNFTNSGGDILLGNLIASGAVTSNASGFTVLSGLSSSLAGLDVQTGGVSGTGALKVTAGASTLSGALKAATLNMSGGSLTLAGTAPTNLTAVTMSGGTLSNAATLTMGSLTVSPLVNFGSVALSGVGAKTVTGALNLASCLSCFSSFYLTDGTLNTQGITTSVKNGFSNQYIYMWNSAINNTGTWAMDGINFYQYVGVDSFTNSGAGVVNVTGTGANFYGVSFNNNSSAASGVNVAAASTLTLGWGGSSSGTFNLGTGATLSFGMGTHTLTNPSAITGTGNVLFADGTTSITGSVVAASLSGTSIFASATLSGATTIGSIANSGATLSLTGTGATGITSLSSTAGSLSVAGTTALLTSLTNSGGTINLSNSTAPMTLTAFNVSGGITNIASAVTVPTLNWTAGELGGAGALNVTTALNMNPAATGSAILNAKTLNVSGATTQGTLAGARMVLNMVGNATINNTGAWTMNNAEIQDAALTPASFFNNNAGGQVIVPASGFGWINGTTFVANTGTSSGMLALGTLVIPLATNYTFGLTSANTVINNGTATVGVGTTSIYGNFLNNGTLDVLAGGNANINGSFTNSATTGILNLAGSLNTGFGGINSGTVNLASTGMINGAFTNLGILTASGGTIIGSFTNQGIVNATAGTTTIGGAFTNANLGLLNVNGGGTLAVASVGSLTNAAGGTINLGNAATTGNISSTLSALSNAGTINSNAPVAGSNTITGSLTNTGSINVQSGANLLLLPGVIDSTLGTLNVAIGSTLLVRGGTVTLGSGTIMGAGGGAVNLTDNGGASPLLLNLPSSFINPVATQTHLAFTSSIAGGVTVNGPGSFTNSGLLDITNVTFAATAPLVNNGALTFTGTQTLTSFTQNDGASLTGTGALPANNVLNVTTGTFSGISALNNLTYNAVALGTTSQGTALAPAVINMQSGAIINNSGIWAMSGTIQDLAATPNTSFNNLLGATFTVPLGGTGVFFGTAFNNAGTLNALGTFISTTTTNAGIFDITSQVILNSFINNGTLQVLAGGTGTVNGNLVNNNLLNVTGILNVGGTFTNSAGATANLNAASTLNVAMGSMNNGTLNAATGTTISGVFTNQNIFNVNSTLALPTTITSTFNNNGVVNVNTGALNVNGGGKGSGSFALATGTNLNVGAGGYTSTAATGITGSGAVSLNGISSFVGSVVANSLTVNPASTATMNGALSVPTIILSGGMLYTTGTVANLTTLALTGYGTLNNTQTITTATLQGYSGSIIGLGGVTVTSALDMSPSFSTLYLANAALTNNGTATLGSSAAINASSQFPGSFNNTGTINVTGAGAAIHAYFNNSGAVNIATATDLTLGGGATSVTPINLVAGAGLVFSNGTYGVSVTGAGSVILSGYNTTINGTITASSLSDTGCGDCGFGLILNGAVAVNTLTMGSFVPSLTLNGRLTATTATIASGSSFMLNSNVAGTPNTIGTLTNNGSVTGTGNLTITSNYVPGLTSTFGSTFTDLSITQASGNFTAGGLTATKSINLAAPKGLLTIGGPIAAPTITASGGTGVTLDLLATLTASAAGDAIVLNTGTGNFVNNAGAAPMNVTGGGRWLVYSNSPLLDSRGALVYNFKQYGTSFGGGILGTGNGLIYTLVPSVITYGLTGTVSKVYDGTNTASLVAGNILAPVGAIDGDTVNALSSVTGSYDNMNAGTGKIVTASGLFSASNGSVVVYGYQYTASGAVGTITPAALTVTANAQSKMYGNADPTLSYVAAGLLGTDTLAGALSRAAGETVSGGPYAITQGTLANSNYSITYTGNNLTITARPISIAADAISKVYGDADPALTYTVGGTLASWDTNATVLSGSLSRVAGENVATGPYAITQGTLANSNYSITYTGNNLTITPATLTVVANDANKIMSTTDPLLSYTVSGLKLSDTESVVLNGGTLSRVLGETVGAYPINQGALGLKTANYTMNYVGATFTILAPTVINEIVNISVQDTNSSGMNKKPKPGEVIVVADAGTSTDNPAMQSLPVCK